MHPQLLDDFLDLANWSAIGSGQARLDLISDSAPAGRSLRMDFDFGNGGGFVVARKPFRLNLPDSYAFQMAVRADAPPNVFEFKLVDSTGTNVWRLHDETFDFDSDWRVLRIPSRAIEFAWGPAGGGQPREIAAIEIVIAAGPGGAGNLWISDLRLDDRTATFEPVVTVSSAAPGSEPTAVLSPSTNACWRPIRSPAWIQLDFLAPRDYEALILRWDSGAPRSLSLRASDDGTHWSVIYHAPRSAGTTSYLYLPDGCSRLLRLDLNWLADEQPPGLAAIEVEPETYARSLDDFFHRLAADAPRGRYPRWLYREQSYWTPVDVPDGRVAALFNEEGMVEVGRAGCAIEPSLLVDGEFLTWADCSVEQRLLEPPLPIPESVWTRADPADPAKAELVLTVTAFAAPVGGKVWLYLRYRVDNPTARTRDVRLAISIRPFQVSPPWQKFQDIGGISPIREIDYRDGLVSVNGRGVLAPLDAPSGFGSAAFDEGPIDDDLAAGRLPRAETTSDPFGCASAALVFDFALAPGARRDVFVTAPMVANAEELGALPGVDTGPDALAATLSEWRQMLTTVEFDLPPLAQAYADLCHTCCAHILINRDGPALQPGPRRYTRSWIRDGATMAAALCRLGLSKDAGEFVRWYAQFQATDGNVPCCVDRDGVDWLPEHDSHGQFIFCVADYFRFSGDRETLGALWPQVEKAVGYLEGLRAQRLTEAFRTGDRHACYGLLPESVSHEGYLAQPVHAYWDDFWALRGFKDAAELASIMGDEAEAERLNALQADFRSTLLASIDATIRDRGIGFLPGSVEWADPDPTSAANALTLIGEADTLPAQIVTDTLDAFMERMRARYAGHNTDWTNYTPYEIRIMGALVRLGRRADAQALASFFLSERRPPAWNQWPEIAWRDPRSPGHQGDVPHTWISAEYCLAFRDFFAYERESDTSLVLGAGVPADWLRAGEVAVRGLPTWYGLLDLSLRANADGYDRVRIAGDLRLPAGGFSLRLPFDRPIRRVLINGEPSTAFNGTEVRVQTFPAEVVIDY